jgi:hypothetical protein
MYPSVPELLVAVIGAQFPAVRVCTELPMNLEQVLPCVQVTRFSGGDSVITMDHAIVDIDVWHSTLGGAEILASQLRSWMRLYLAGKRATVTSGTGTFARVYTQSGFYQRPSANPDVRRVGGVMEFWVHSS